MRNILPGVLAFAMAVLLFVLTAGVIFAPSYSSAVLTAQTAQTERDGCVVTTTTFLSSAGKPVTASDKGYASVVKTAREGKTVLEEYLDEKGNPAVLPAGYSLIQREYTDGLNTKIIYLDRDRQPVVVSSGYDTVRRTYNDDRLSDTDTYWVGEEQVRRKQGYWSLRRIHGTGTDRKRVVRQEYRDRYGLLTTNSSGYAYWERTYNGQGKVAVQRFFGPDGRPVSISIGYCGYQRAYDEEGRVVQITYLGADGETANTSRGYAVVKTLYADNGKKTLYYDLNGKPVTMGKNQFGVLETDDGSTFLNEDGEVLFRLDNILNTHPGLVLFLGVFASFLALLVKGRLRIGLIVIYLAFILYMTVAWRETLAHRPRFDLFWSYREMLTSGKLNLQILENIWLFVPFGAALKCALRDRLCRDAKAVGWTVLICVLLSAAIEAIQLAAGIGMCDIDDVFSNGLGGLIGALLPASDSWKKFPFFSAGKKQE